MDLPPPGSSPGPSGRFDLDADQRRRLGIIAVVGAVVVGLAVLGSVVVPLRDPGPPAVSDAGIACGEDDMRGDRSYVAVAALTEDRTGLERACHGPDSVLAPLFAAVDELTPPDLRDDIAYVGVFVDRTDIVAFTQRLEGGRFVLAMQRDAIGDPVLRRLTLAHELAHVVVGDEDQYLPSWLEGSCPTVLTLTGCLAEDSLLLDWIDRFWPPELLRQIDLLTEPEIVDGEERCAADPAYLSAYGAADPEEDLAEVVSAYVLDVDVHAAAGPRLEWVDDVPAFRALRDRARAQGLGPLPNVLGECG